MMCDKEATEASIGFDVALFVFSNYRKEPFAILITFCSIQKMQVLFPILLHVQQTLPEYISIIPMALCQELFG